MSASSWTFTLATPDAVVAGAIPWLLDKLRGAALEPVAAALVRLDAPTMLALYRYGPGGAPSRLPPERAFELWYDLGPACVIALHSTRPDAAADMLVLKGMTDPRLSPAGSIRRAGENALMNLVHCPDDELAAKDELLALAGAPRAAALRRLAASPCPAVRALTIDSLEDALPAWSGKEALSVPCIANRLRLRVVQKLALHAEDVELSLLTEARAILRDERSNLLAAETSVARTDIARASDAAIQAQLAPTIHDAESPTREALAAVSRLVQGTGDRSRALATIRGAGVYLADIESSALEIASYL